MIIGKQGRKVLALEPRDVADEVKRRAKKLSSAMNKTSTYLVHGDIIGKNRPRLKT